MKVCLTIPSFAVHGGIRVILEWANRLTKWHQVSLYSKHSPSSCDWFQIDQRIGYVSNIDELRYMDRLIICSPHDIHLRRRVPNVKKFIFMQMAEHLFRPSDLNWLNRCMRFYQAPNDMIAISKWNIEMVKNEYGRTGSVHYVGNGVNLDDFPISNKPKDGITVLVEGWESSNPSKDPDHIGPKVAARLKDLGYYILAFSASPLKTLPSVPHEYYHKPSLQQMNDLYERATILIKATRFDARSCAPVEAMTKGTVTVRAIERGDDDLTEQNSYLVPYDEELLFNKAKFALVRHCHREEKEEACLRHVQHYNWDFWMEKINDIICKS